MSTTIDEQFVTYIVKSLVGKPDAVSIKRTIDEKGVLLELTVDPEDLGRVIGKRGATAQSLRTLLRALGTKNEARYNLKIVDNGPPREERMPREPREEPAAAGVVSDDAWRSSDETPAEEPADTDSGAETEPEEASAPIEPMAEAPAEPEKDEDDNSSMAEKTRKELSDLDDLDI